MSKDSRVEALSGAATLASLFLAGVLGAHPGPLGAAAAIVVDSDHDGIPDARDNCPHQQHLEQFVGANAGAPLAARSSAARDRG